MLLGIISDTHDRLEQFDAALNFFHERRVSSVIHCGDWKSIATVQYCAERAAALSLNVYGVLGNNDIAVEAFITYADSAPGKFYLARRVLEITLSGKKIAAYHGHHVPTRRDLLINPLHDVILLGHSHKPRIETIGSTLCVNPGSTAFAIPRSKTWRPSVALIDLNPLSAEIYYL